MNSLALSHLERMMFIRAFEAALAKRPDHGFQLLSAGEEAVAVGLASALNEHDQLLTSGRSIAPALARGVDPGAVLAELLGKTGGMNRGRGGRGHMSAPNAGFFGAHAVVGGNLSIAAGVALTKQLSGDPGIVVVLFGDGACGAGALHETLNMAAVWKLPLLFVCNNNQLSVSTERTAILAPEKLSDIGAAFGTWARTVDGMDLNIAAAAAKEAADYVRSGKGPAFLEFESFRFLSHSTTARETRSRDALAKIRANCPIDRQIAALGLSEAEVANLRATVAVKLQDAVTFAEASPYPDVSEVLDHVG